MHVFTNTVTTAYGYQLQLVIYSDNGLTSTTTVTGGDYILSIGDITEELDPHSGEYKPGSMSLKLKNTNDEFSDNVFGGTIVEIEARLWISYDSGTTWENLFYGMIDWQGLKREDKDATETTNQVFSVAARHAALSLKDVTIDTDPDEPGGNVPTTGVVTPSVTLSSYATDAVGSAFAGSADYDDYKFISLDGILQYFFSNIQFISGSQSPTLSYDSTAMQHKGKSLTGAGVEFTFDELYMLFQSPTVAAVEGFFSYSAGKYGIYGLKNLQEALRLFMDSLLMIPITRLTESAGSYTLNVYFEPRFRAAADLTAITGTLSPIETRSLDVQQWLDGIQVLTTGLPKTIDKTYYVLSYGGRTFEIKNHLLTGPYFNVDPYVFLYTHIVPEANSGEDTTRHDGPSAQMLYGILGSGPYTVNTIHQFKHLTSQSYFGDATTGSYYSVNDSIYDIVTSNLDPASRSSIYGQKGYEQKYKTLASDNSGTKSIWDVRLLKKLTIDSTTCQIVSIKRNVMKNEMTIRAIEVL